MSKTKTEKKVEPQKPTKLQKPKGLVITEKAFLTALKKLEKDGKTANITPMYEAFDKTGFAGVEPSKLKTVIRARGLKMAKAKNPKVQAVHVDGSRSYTFKSA